VNRSKGEPMKDAFDIKGYRGQGHWGSFQLKCDNCFFGNVDCSNGYFKECIEDE